MLQHDWPLVRAIYEQGIASGHATFETNAPDWQQWDAAHCSNGRLLILQQNEIVGWAALSKASQRQVYSGVAEVSIYIAAAARGKGLGSQLLSALVNAAEAAGYWTLQSSIFPENKASVQMHLKNGFRIIGYRERVACMNGQWRNTVLLERRSTVNGIT